jgi:MFS transporter, ACS family, D-galactonate transporter
MTATAQPSARAHTGFWDRELHRYPAAPTRFTCLGIVVLATIVLYYQFYLAGALATHILVDYHMSFVYYVNISVVGYVFGAVASFVTGVADRYGRANIVTVGLFVVGLLCLFGVPLAHSKLGFGIVFVAIGLVEGIILVATPALIRDFSPQLGRASAMGFWTLGPVLGSLVVSVQVSNTSDRTAWQDHYLAAGIVGVVVALLSALFLRELAPGLRDQLMVSARDRALIEARAKGIDVTASVRGPFRQMLKPDIILSAFAIAVFLIIYYTAVGFFPVYFQTIFHHADGSPLYSQQDANALGNWNWAFNAGALLVVGFLSDKLRVRKPFMVVGAIGAIVFTIIFLTRATHPQTSYGTFVWILVLLAMSLGVAYAPWMASFTETVERRNPALTATGLAVWGLVIRIVIALSVFIVPHIVNTVTTLVEKGPQAQAIVAQYPNEIATAQKIDPATSAALAANPKDPAADVKAISEITGVPSADVATIAKLNAEHGPALAAARVVDRGTLAALLTNPADTAAATRAVQEITGKLGISPAEAATRLKDLAQIPTSQLLLLQQSGQKVLTGEAALVALGKVPPSDFALLQNVSSASEHSPHQWQTYYWIAVGGQIVFIPLIFLMAGFWSPRRAKRHEQEHEAWLQQELAKLG